MKGELRTMLPEYMAECFSCDWLDSISAKTYRRVEMKFRDEGWRKRNGKWYCPKCVVVRHGLKDTPDDQN